MKKFTCWIIMAWCIVGRAQDSLPVIVINNVNVIPMTEQKIVTNQRVVIAGDKIMSIGSASDSLHGHVSLVIDGTGKYLIPGLAEMHYHFRNKDITSDLKLLVTNGITTVRNMAATPDGDQIRIRDSIRRGQLLPVNYFTTGPYLQSRDLGNERDVTRIVADHIRKGYDFLKIADNLPVNIYLALLQKCQAANLPIVGHAQRELPVEYSMRMKSIEHIEELMYIPSSASKRNSFEESDSVLQKLATSLQQSGVYMGTTLTGFEFITNCLDDQRFKTLQNSLLKKYLAADQRKAFLSEQNDYRKLRFKNFNGLPAKVMFDNNFQWMKKMAGLLQHHHVPLLAGSDTYGMTIVGFSLHREFSLLQSCGLTPYEILLAATVNPARYLGIYSTCGTIVQGKYADLVLLEANPLEDITNTDKISGVFLKGKWMDAADLQQKLGEVERAFR